MKFRRQVHIIYLLHMMSLELEIDKTMNEHNQIDQFTG